MELSVTEDVAEIKQFQQNLVCIGTYLSPVGRGPPLSNLRGSVGLKLTDVTERTAAAEDPDLPSICQLTVAS